jgi:outer membrane protein assembly factor BamA
LFLSGQANAQLANRNLDASEKLGVGGPNAVRAFRADEGSVDDGAVFNLGLYKRIPVATGHQVQFGIFSDFAIGRVNHNPWPFWESSYVGIPNVSNRRILSGYGLSLDWLTPIGATISASVSKAYGFSSTSWVDPGKKPLQYWLSVTWSK